MLLEEREEEEGVIQCDPIGDPVFTDLEGNKFYTELFVNNIIVRLGNSVRIKLEEDEDGHDTSFGQVLAIKHTKEDEVFVEIRWLLRPKEVVARRKKILTEELLENELVESTTLDDIYAGAIVGLITLNGFDRRSSKRGDDPVNGDSPSHLGSQTSTSTESSSFFVRRFMEVSGSNSIQRVPHHSYFRRGMDWSHYEYAYESILETYDGSEGALPTDKFSVAIRKLHVSMIPDQLPCRTEEREEVETFIRSAITSGDTGKPMYICGMPGTGKTATVAATLKSLLKEAQDGTLPEFNAVEINCLRLHTPSDAYVQLWRHLTGEFVGAKLAERNLINYFESDPNSRTRKSAAPRKLTVCLVDEIDFLTTRDENIVYNFFNWPLNKNSGLLLIGVSNVMDLPERLSTRVTSRVSNNGIKRINFKPYSHEQVKEILENRLGELEQSIFDKNALELLARKASTIAGDVRAALKICQRAIELNLTKSSQRAAEALSSVASASAAASASASATTAASAPAKAAAEPGKVTIAMVIQAAKEYKESPLFATISRSCALDKAVLACMCRHAKAVGTSDITPDLLWDRFNDLMHDMKKDPAITLQRPPLRVFQESVERLVEQGLIERKLPRSATALGGAMANKRAILVLQAAMTDTVAALKGHPIWNYVAKI